MIFRMKPYHDVIMQAEIAIGAIRTRGYVGGADAVDSVVQEVGKLARQLGAGHRSDLLAEPMRTDIKRRVDAIRQLVGEEVLGVVLDDVRARVASYDRALPRRAQT